MSTRVYLAGPDVFLVNARDVGARKKAICARHGLTGVFPTDEDAALGLALSRSEQGLAISRAMESVMQSCDAMIVNLTPFRGPSADVGSAYEMGFMRALGRPIYAYTNDARPFFAVWQRSVTGQCAHVWVECPRIPTEWPSSPSSCTTTLCSPAASLPLAAVSLPRLCHMPNATLRLSSSNAASHEPRRNCCGNRRPAPA
jgi:nucleoside 2-deoxyribosyltransferase